MNTDDNITVGARWHDPTDTDPHVSSHRIVDDAWLASGRGDITFGARWENGFWTTELSRALHTGDGGDVRFGTSMTYLSNEAEFDHSRHGYEHRTSPDETLIFVNSQKTGRREGGRKGGRFPMDLPLPRQGLDTPPPVW